MKLFLVFAEAQDLAHLRLRVAACAGVSHGQAGGNAVRRKEEVAGRAAEMGVEIKCKRGVALDQRFGLGRLGTRGQSNAE